MSLPIKKSKKYIPKIAQDDINEDDIIKEDNPITADFIKLQHIVPPAIPGTAETSRIGVGKASKISMLLKDPYYNRPKSNRKKSTIHKKQSNVLANYPHIIKEINNAALKQQEKQISDSLIKPLTAKGIKVNNIRTIYRK